MPTPRESIDSGLPAPGIIQELLDRYYSTDQAECGASSHWRMYAGRFKVERDASAALVQLKGAGFGNASWRGWAHWLFDSATIAAHLVQLPEKRALIRSYLRLRNVCGAMRLDPTFDAFRQACSLVLLGHHVRPAMLPRIRVMIIGDGHGILAGLVKHLWPEATVTLVDLGRTLLFQTVNCQRAYPTARHSLATAGGAGLWGDFVYCPADCLDAIEGLEFDVAVNIASMQEMTPETVGRYFSFLRRNLLAENLFYCCNRERKVLPDGETSSFADYPWSVDDQIVLDGLCPWHQYFLAPTPVVLRRYDGPHRHRLSTLATERA